MRLLLLGADGQVGWELRRSLAPLGLVTAWTRRDADLGDELTALTERVRALRPDAIVNAAGYTAVDRAESEPALAMRVNAEAPAALAAMARELGAWLLHYSSDYVFDGRGDSARDETAATGPLSVYGRSKLAGEQAIAASGCRHLILRTSWVHAARGGNFAKTMLRLACERDRLAVVADQVGAPTGAELIADVSAHLLRQVRALPADAAATIGGLYHLAAGGATSWHGYACHVIETARRLGWPVRVAPDAVQPIATADYPTPARRPLNSRLDTTKLQRVFGLHLPPWQAGVDRMLLELERPT